MFRLKVKEIAQQKGLSQRQLFLRSGVDITIIRKIFRDPHTVVTVEELMRLAKVLEVDLCALIENVDIVPDNANSILTSQHTLARGTADLTARAYQVMSRKAGAERRVPAMWREGDRKDHDG